MSGKRVLFLCTGNSARSQMAEGLVNHFLGGQWEAFSARTAPSGYVHPLAVQAMADLEIDAASQRPKSTDEFRNVEFDVVITVCDQATQNCPVWLGNGHRKHLSFPDPAAATGSEREKLETFRRVRDGLKQEIFAYLKQIEQEEVKSHAP